MGNHAPKLHGGRRHTQEQQPAKRTRPRAKKAEPVTEAPVEEPQAEPVAEPAPEQAPGES